MVKKDFKETPNSNPNASNLSKFHLDYFFLLTFKFFLLNRNSKNFYKLLYVDKNFWFKTFCMFFLSVPNSANHTVDGFFYATSADKGLVQFNTGSFFGDYRLSVFSEVTHLNFTLASTSKLFKSNGWLERELSEFSGVSFIGLDDTRRLLLDYFDVKGSRKTHVANDKNFNNNYYDIFLTY